MKSLRSTLVFLFLLMLVTLLQENSAANTIDNPVPQKTEYNRYGSYLGMSHWRDLIQRSNVRKKTPPPISGEVYGGKISRLICENLTTYQQVIAKVHKATSWDCMEYGLVVNPGDKIKTSVHIQVSPQP